MRKLYRRLLLGLMLVGPLITVPKLHRMAVATGRLPGGKHYTATVTNKWSDRDPRGLGMKYNFSWRLDAPKPVEDLCETAARVEDWERLQVGGPVEIVEADGWMICPLSVYVEPGNFLFDYALLGIEAVTWILFIRFLTGRRKRSNSAVPQIVRY